MAAPSDYLDTADLKALTKGGLVAEDVMRQIWQISPTDVPFTTMISASEPAKNSYHEWTLDVLATPVTTNAVVSGADVASYNNGSSGTRVGNHCQNSTKAIAVTERVNNTEQFGRANELAYQLQERQKELKRDVEAASTYINASVADNNNATAGQAASFSSWCISNDDLGATGTATGFNTSTGVVAAPSPGNKRALSFATLQDQLQAAYVAGGNPSILMSQPGLIRRLSNYLVKNSNGNIASLSNTYDGPQGGPMTGTGAVNVLVSDFGIQLKMIPNRTMIGYTAADTGTVTDVLIIDPAYVCHSYLKDYTAAPLGKLGLSERWLLSVDWTVVVRNEAAHAVIRDINFATAVTA